MFGGGSHYAKRLNGNIRTTAVLPAVDTWAGGGPAGPDKPSFPRAPLNRKNNELWHDDKYFQI